MAENGGLTEEYLLNDDDEYFVCENCGYQQRQTHEDNDATPEDFDPQQRVARLRNEMGREFSADEDSDTESVVSVSLNPIEELPMIQNPFATPGFQKQAPKWQIPVNVASDRDSQFKWEKPWGGEDTENETPAQRIRRLEQTIQEKKQDLEVLGKQYSKAHHENYKLSEQIGSFKGEHYDDLKADNKKLREENGRLFRENMQLRAQMKQMSNRKMAEMEEKRVLDEKYGVKSRRKGPKKSN